jgi:hypothetical protein
VPGSAAVKYEGHRVVELAVALAYASAKPGDALGLAFTAVGLDTANIKWPSTANFCTAAGWGTLNLATRPKSP